MNLIPISIIKKELLEPVLLHPDKYVYLTKEDIINEYDKQMAETVNYFKEFRDINRIGRKIKSEERRL
ncbi:MAG: hypothetical protein L6V91_10315 [Bacilli bacterium]|nr:MAG: hypothetical protein L6V91_10315 [Bacilli bacterium]